MPISSAKTLTVVPEASCLPGNFCLWIRTASGPEIGFGHLRRSIILARSLSDCGVPLFLVDSQDWWSQEQIASEGFSFVSRELDEIWFLFPNPKAILIDTRLEAGLDHLVAEARNRKIPVVSIHDLGLNPIPSDVLIDGSLSPLFGDFSYRHATLCGGTPYQVLDPVYSSLHQRRKQLNKKIKSVAVNLGGGNSGKYFEKVLEGLKLWEHKLDVIGVPGFTSWGQEILSQRDWSPIHFHWDSLPFDRILIQVDLAITAGGLSAYEALCTGTPLLALSRDHLQQITVTKLSQTGACMDLGLGDDLDPNKLPEVLSLLESSWEKRKSLSRRGKQIVDGRGAERVSWIIRRLIHKSPIASYSGVHELK